MKSVDSKLLIGLVVGAAVGAAVRQNTDFFCSHCMLFPLYYKNTTAPADRMKRQKM